MPACPSTWNGKTEEVFFGVEHFFGVEVFFRVGQKFFLEGLHLFHFKKRLGSDVEKVYPYSAMLEQFRKFGKFGLYMASMLVPMLTADASAAPDLDAFSEEISSGKEMNNNIFNSEGSEERLAKRLSDVIHDMDRLGYI